MGCGGGEPQGGAAEAARGARLVAGSSLDEWGLLVVPRAGGPASLRSLRDPSRTVWVGAAELPASVEARALEDGLVVLRDAGGEVYRWEPGSGGVVALGRVGASSRWVAGGRAGLFLDPEGREVLTVSRAGSWRYAIPYPVEWASPLEPGMIALLVRPPAGTQAWVLRQGEERPSATLEAPLAPPGVATAWGRRIVLAGTGDEAGTLRVLTVAPLAGTAGLEVGDPPLVLAASPSTHEIYAGLDDPPRLRAVNRFNGARRDLGRFPRPLAELRTLPFGDPLLAHDGSRTYRLPVGGGDPQPVDAEWRLDLPLALPGGRVLFARGDEVRVVAPGGVEAGERVDGPADAWWLAVRWSPLPPRLVAGEVAGEPLSAEAAGVAEEDAGAAGAPRERAGERSAGESAAPRVAEPGAETEAGVDAEAGGLAADPAETAGAATGAAPGFYAIVGSARSPQGIRELTEALSAAGYPTALQAVRDDAGDAWHRGLVGPFRSRGEAEAAARQLERERRLQAWVTEVGGEVADGRTR